MGPMALKGGRGELEFICRTTPNEDPHRSAMKPSGSRARRNLLRVRPADPDAGREPGRAACQAGLKEVKGDLCNEKGIREM